jgi:hypothetical protein
LKFIRIVLFFRRWCKIGLRVLFFGIMIGCDSGATDVGIEGFNSGGAAGTPHIDTLYADAISDYKSFMDSVSTGSADRLYLGSVDGCDFKIVMRFVFPSDVDSVVVTSAHLRMTSTASYGSGGSFTAAVHPVQKKWSEADLRWSRFDDRVDTAITYAQATITNAPAAGTVFSFPIPKDTVQHWIYATTDTNRHNYGIMIDVPAGAAFAQQFYSANNTINGQPDTTIAPRLVLTYQQLVSGQIVDKQLSVSPVTLTSATGGSTYTGGDHGYLYRDRNAQPANTITVGSGVVYHALLRFNTTKLPPSATVSNAVLVMKVDPAHSYNYTASTDSIALQAIRVETLPAKWAAGEIAINATDYAILKSSGLFHDHLTDHIKGTDDTLRLTLGGQMQAWVIRPSTNTGFELFNGNELNGDFKKFYRVRFFNDPVGDRDRSPKIVIYYTLPPSN